MAPLYGESKIAIDIIINYIIILRIVPLKHTNFMAPP